MRGLITNVSIIATDYIPLTIYVVSWSIFFHISGDLILDYSS